MTDRELFAEYRKTGSGELFTEIVSRHMDMVHSTCKRVLREDHAAEDAAQATFLLLVRKAKKLSRKTVLSGWLFRSAQFTALRLSRSKTRRARHEREAAMEKEQAIAAATAANWGDVSPELDTALATLTSHQQNVVVMRLMQHKPQADVARELGCAESSVSAVLSRSLEKLRGKLSKMGVSLSAAALGAMLAENAVVAAPAGLAASIGAACLGQTAASASAAALTDGVAKAMLVTKLKMVAVVVAGAAAVSTGGIVTVGQLAAAEMAKPVKNEAAEPILTQKSRWRTYAVRAPRVISGGGSRKPEKGIRTAPPQDGWIKPSFDDVSWASAAGPFPGGHRGHAGIWGILGRELVCVRGRFEVKDPRGVKRLTLVARYVGGVVVYLNGREVFRGHMPKGDIKSDTPALPYTKDAYLDSKGRPIPLQFRANRRIAKGEKDLVQRIAMRSARKLGPVALPSDALVKGVNVLAIAVHRSVFLPEARKWRGKYNQSTWPHIGLDELRLAADADIGAITPSLVRPAGLQAWIVDPHTRMTGREFADVGRKLQAVKMVGGRGGYYSGVVAVGSDKPVGGLKVVAGELKGPGVIPAGNVEVRYGHPTRLGFGRTQVLASLEDKPPAALGGEGKDKFGAIPVWVTVHVPSDAKPGNYAGEVSVVADGAAEVKVPVALEVVDWSLPDSKNFSTHMGVYQSYDSLALQYDVPMWSEKHWKYVEQSWKVLGLLGNNIVVVPLVCRTEFGNDESMITWVKGKDGKHTYDFKVFDRYMDIAQKHCDLQIVSAQVYFGGGWGAADPAKRPASVTVIDAKSGKREAMQLPAYGTDESRKLWKPFIAALRERLAKRGLKDRLVLGIGHCGGMHKGVVAFFEEIAPEVSWHIARHNRSLYTKKGKNESYCEYLYVAKSVPSPAKVRKYGWKRDGKGMFVMCQRIYDFYQPAISMRTMAERALLLGDAGPGRICHDYWPVKGSSQHGGRKSIFDRFPNARAGQRCPHLTYLSSPGEKGPTVTQKILMIREGLQEAEGRIYLEKALLEKKVDGELAARVQKLLDERVALCQATHRGGKGLINAASGEGWRKRSSRLYRMLGEVSKKLGK